MLGFLLMTLIFIGALVGVSKILDVKKIKDNWPEYRCRPDVMLMADFYGHDSTENLQYCLKGGFDFRASSLIAPFYTYLKAFVEILMTLLSSINSIRMIFATIIGSVTQVFSEFSSRIQALFYRIQMTSIRMKFLMGRVFAMMYGVIFMGMSGIKAGQNFSNTFLFQFLDTFCFDPDTPIEVVGKGSIPIKDLRIGDILENGKEKVTATFKFVADGQPMVFFPARNQNPGILVSTNHYLLHNGKWIKASEHPDALPANPWNGGKERPLICLNTNTHSFTLGGYKFKDYDESEEGDEEAMRKAEEILNCGKSTSKTTDSTMTFSPNTILKGKNGQLIPASQIVLGEELSHGTVVGIVKKETVATCEIDGVNMGLGTLVWLPSKNSWIRAGDLVVIEENSKILQNPETYYSFVVSPSAIIETSSGLIVRDYVEVHSPDMESSYSEALAKEISN